MNIDERASNAETSYVTDSSMRDYDYDQVNETNEIQDSQGERRN